MLFRSTPVEPRELTIQGEEGHDIHGWVFVPKGRGPHPVLLNIHGDPFSNFNWGFFDEAQVYVRAGYAVVVGELPASLEAEGSGFRELLGRRGGQLSAPGSHPDLPGPLISCPGDDEGADTEWCPPLRRQWFTRPVW